MNSNRQNIASGTPFEAKFGYSRAVRVGNQVFVAGTAPLDEKGNTVGGDMYSQAKFIWTKIERALNEAGAGFGDVVRTRTFVTDISHWHDAMRAHGEIFHDIRPASTLVEVTALVRPDLLLEIEVDAVIGNS
jgi:enamine deaminase RidA (YjgF/YER057c/UK114 family)